MVTRADERGFVEIETGVVLKIQQIFSLNALGIVVPDGLTAELAELRELSVLQQVLTQGSSIAIMELCCSEHSNLRKVCEVSEGPIHWCSC